MVSVWFPCCFHQDHVTREKQIEAARAAGCPDSWLSIHVNTRVTTRQSWWTKGQFKRIWENNIRHLHDIYMTIYCVEKSTELLMLPLMLPLFPEDLCLKSLHSQWKQAVFQMVLFGFPRDVGANDTTSEKPFGKTLHKTMENHHL